MFRRTLPAALAALALAGLTACQGGAETPPTADSRSASSGSLSAAAPVEGAAGLPGDEALVPPPPDPAADDQRALLARMPAGALAGDVEMTVSGLVGFAERVTGRCLTTESNPALEVDLSDGSVLRIQATVSGLASSLLAPGVEARHLLADVDLTSGPLTVLVAHLLIDGTTEPNGSVRLEFTCA